MKKILPVFVLICALILPIPAFAEQMTTTVLVYMAGNDLESDGGSASLDLEEMTAAGLPDDGSIQILVETGGTKDWKTEEIPDDELGRFAVSGEGLTLLETQADANMGKASTLSDFIAYGLETAPADRYVLVLWGHGNGAMGGVCYDERHRDDSLMPEELSQALEDGLNGTRLDAVVFDACCMSCLEVAQAVSPYADYMVASQELTAGDGLDYDQWLILLGEDPDMDTEELCVNIAQSYITSHSYGMFSDACTMSVLNLSYTDRLTDAVENFSEALLVDLPTQTGMVLARRASLKSFGTYGIYNDENEPTDFVDALHLAQIYIDLIPAESSQLRSAVKHMVVYSGATKPVQDAAAGVSITMPYETTEWFYTIYDYYKPLADDSDYAKLVVKMARTVEQSETVQDSSQSAEMLPMEEMWTGLQQAASQSSEMLPMEEMWTGLQ